MTSAYIEDDAGITENTLDSDICALYEAVAAGVEALMWGGELSVPEGRFTLSKPLSGEVTYKVEKVDGEVRINMWGIYEGGAGVLYYLSRHYRTLCEVEGTWQERPKMGNYTTSRQCLGFRITVRRVKAPRNVDDD